MKGRKVGTDDQGTPLHCASCGREPAVLVTGEDGRRFYACQDVRHQPQGSDFYTIQEIER